MTALRLILERTLENRDYPISAVAFMTELHSDRWVLHPDNKQHLSYCTLLLNSLVESCDLKKVEILYSLLPKALLTIASYEEKDTRHRDSLRQQRALSWLTFALVAVGMIQLVLAWLNYSKLETVVKVLGHMYTLLTFEAFFHTMDWETLSWTGTFL